MKTYTVYCPSCGVSHEVDASVIAAQNGKVRSEKKRLSSIANSIKANEARKRKRDEKKMEEVLSSVNY